MLEQVWSGLANDVGARRSIALAAGVLVMMLGAIAWSLRSAPTRQAVREATAPPPRRLLSVAAVFLLAVGTLTVLGVGVILPLATLKQEVYKLDRIDETLERTEGKIEFLRTVHFQQQVLIVNESVRELRELLSRTKYRDPKRLQRHEVKVCSQNGEDGTIAEIFRRIGAKSRYFVDFGSSDGVENNTSLLLRQGWSGLWIEADPDLVASARTRFASFIADGKLTVIQDFITAENIEDLFRKGKVPEEFDLLSVDIDRNDYYVWEKITHYRPCVAVVEYNSGIPPTMSWVVPYDAKAFGHGVFGTGNGASLKALEELGSRKGYRLVGCDLCGVNSFFVREDLLGDHFAAPYTAENHFEPFRFEHIRYPRCDPSILDDPGKGASGPDR